MAEIGWIDFSTADRKKMSQVMSLIRPEGQLDELGVGRIRDGLANELFPGISTIQTRAKYFFIVPYILRDYLYLSAREKGKTTSTLYLEDREHEVKNRLRAKYAGQSNTGIIGITLRESQRIVRQPSEIYWVGLNSFGCMDTDGLALSGFLKNLNQKNQQLNGRPKEDETDDDQDAGLDYEIQIKVPSTVPNWKDTIDIKLSKEEAGFLKKQLQDKANIKLSGSILQELFQQTALLQSMLDNDNFSNFALIAVKLPTMPHHLKHKLTLAHDFAIVVHGAHILYNHILQQHFYPDQYAGGFLEEWQKWHASLADEMIDFENFHIADLSDWMSESKFFMNKWWEYVQPSNIEDMEPLLQHIRMREFVVKGKKARLRNSRNDFKEMALNKWIGLKPLQFRFGNAKRIIEDILNPNEDV